MLLEPVYKALHPVPPPVRLVVERGLAPIVGALILATGDHGVHVSAGEQATHAGVAVSPVPDEALGSHVGAATATGPVPVGAP